MHDLIVFGLGVLVGGGACALSAKTLGWFNKQVKSAEVLVKKDL